jgi:hypothetical protein
MNLRADLHDAPGLHDRYAVSGSSSNSTRGRTATARAIETRTCTPRSIAP